MPLPIPLPLSAVQLLFYKLHNEEEQVADPEDLSARAVRDSLPGDQAAVVAPQDVRGARGLRGAEGRVQETRGELQGQGGGHPQARPGDPDPPHQLLPVPAGERLQTQEGRRTLQTGSGGLHAEGERHQRARAGNRSGLRAAGAAGPQGGVAAEVRAVPGEGALHLLRPVPRNARHPQPLPDAQEVQPEPAARPRPDGEREGAAQEGLLLLREGHEPEHPPAQQRDQGPVQAAGAQDQPQARPALRTRTQPRPLREEEPRPGEDADGHRQPLLQVQRGRHPHQAQPRGVRGGGRRQGQEAQEERGEAQEEARGRGAAPAGRGEQHGDQVQAGHPEAEEHLRLHQGLPLHSRGVQEADSGLLPLPQTHLITRNLSLSNMIHPPISLLVLTLVAAIEVPLKLGAPTCLALMSSFDPVHVEIKFPEVASHIDGEQFRMKLFEVVGEAEMMQVFIGPGTTYRKSYELIPNVIYELCISYDSDRTFDNEPPVYLSYTAEEDFQSRIGQVEIPPELVKEENLKRIFKVAKKLESVSRVVSAHQAKERQLEDEIVSKNIHKSQRILTLGLIETLVIILSGVYQIFALRKFLMEKNLY